MFGTDVIGVYRQSRLPGLHRTAIRSERRLCDEVHLNLAYRWLCRLGLEGGVPNHSTFTEKRHGRRRDSDLFRRLFEQVVRLCMQAGLVGGEGFAIDASVIEADASRNRKAPGNPAAWPEDEAVTRPVQEYLDALDAAVPCEAVDAGGRPSPGAPDDMPPGNPPSEPQFTSLTHPAATGTMLVRGEECFGLQPGRLAADAAYGSGLMIGWLMRRGITPHVPTLDHEHQTKGRFTRTAFQFDAARV